jgi:hypothetical protein
MDPSEFFLKYYSKLLAAPFLDTSLYDADLHGLLELRSGDVASIQKFRVSIICMAIFLGTRAVREAAIIKFSHGFKSIEAIGSVVIKAEEFADSIIEDARINTANPSLPAYVDEGYFPKWKNRYHQCAQEYKQGELRQATILSCFRQCTFSYENENAIIATHDRILDQIVSEYEIYVGAIRNLLGQEILN